MEKTKGDDNLSIEEVKELWKESREVSWSRTKTVSALEAGTLAGAYVTYHDQFLLFAVFILTLGTLLMFALFLVMHRDWQRGKYFRKRLDDAKKMGNFGEYLLNINVGLVVAFIPLCLVFANIAVGVLGFVLAGRAC